jgi:hypothetical protein
MGLQLIMRERVEVANPVVAVLVNGIPMYRLGGRDQLLIDSLRFSLTPSFSQAVHKENAS